jgi:hypothetical protein
MEKNRLCLQIIGAFPFLAYAIHPRLLYAQCDAVGKDFNQYPGGRHQGAAKQAQEESYRDIHFHAIFRCINVFSSRMACASRISKMQGRDFPTCLVSATRAFALSERSSSAR